MIRYKGPTARGDPVCDFCGRLYARTGMTGPLNPFDTRCGMRMHAQCVPLHVAGPPLCTQCQGYDDENSDADSEESLEATPSLGKMLCKPCGPSAKTVIARDKSLREVLNDVAKHRNP